MRPRTTRCARFISRPRAQHVLTFRSGYAFERVLQVAAVLLLLDYGEAGVVLSAGANTHRDTPRLPGRRAARERSGVGRGGGGRSICSACSALKCWTPMD
jgi:hypothetical protein